MTVKIDLNADLGEGMGQDDALLELISSCNIACGGHAGTSETMAATLRAAKANGVACGAHPAYPDREGFGRRVIDMAPDRLEASINSQLNKLADIAAALDIELSHVKPHGALYHQADSSPSLAALIARATTKLGPDMRLVGPPGGALSEAAKSSGLTFIAEGFADRAYDDDGRLVPRSQPGAVLETIDASVDQALNLARSQTVRSLNGRVLEIPVRSLCVHGDTPDAVQRAQMIRKAFNGADIQIAAP